MTNADAERLFAGHQHLALLVAGRMRRRLPRCVDPDELYTAALAGLWRAAQQFEPARGLRFSTLACRLIRYAVFDWLRETGQTRRRNRPPVAFSQMGPKFSASLLERDGRHFEDGLGRLKTEHAATGRRVNAVDPVEMVEMALCAVSPRQRKIVELYYFEDLTMRQVALRLGCWETNVLKILRRALARMRERLLRKESP